MCAEHEPGHSFSFTYRNKQFGALKYSGLSLVTATASDGLVFHYLKPVLLWKQTFSLGNVKSNENILKGKAGLFSPRVISWKSCFASNT